MIIKKKTIGGISLALVLATSLTPIYGASLEVLPISGPVLISDKEREVVADNLDYTIYEGIIQEVVKEDGYVTVKIGDPDKDGYGEAVLNLREDTLVLDNKGNDKNKLEIEKGNKITAYSRNDKPMLMIYPPTLTPEVAIIYDQSEIGNVTYASFDENLISHDNFLKLNIDDKTVITDIRGDKMTKEELANRNLIVFYTFLTKSLPAQTTPTRIVVLDELEDLSHLIIEHEIKEFIHENHYYIGDVQMVPLREISEKLGYTVNWDNDNRSVILEKDKSIAIFIGKTDIHVQENILGTMLYDEDRGPNPDDGKFYITGTPTSSLDYEAQIKDNKTYVPVSFIDFIK